MTSADCIYANTDIPSHYVAETLPRAESETFEEHYFSCARCWQEIQAGSAARVVLEHLQGKPKASRLPLWMSLAAAAVIGIVALVAVRDRAVRETPDVLRGEAERTIAVVLERAAAQLQIHWPAVARASRYDITVLSAEGEVLLQKSSAETKILMDGISDRDLFVRVTAYDSQGEEIARSPLVRVPSR